jgi:hypothetical protein
MKDAQAAGVSFNPQKRTSSNSKHETSLLFTFLWVIFALLDPDPDPATQIGIHADPDPQPWVKVEMEVQVEGVDVVLEKMNI